MQMHSSRPKICDLYNVEELKVPLLDSKCKDDTTLNNNKKPLKGILSKEIHEDHYM